MNQQIQACDTQQTQDTPRDPTLSRLDAAELLRKEFGIPSQAMHWLLYLASYRPTVARFVEVDLPGAVSTVMHADGWLRADLLAAGRRFLGECTKVTATLWSHPKVIGRFKLRFPADLVITASTAPEPSSARPRVGRNIPRINLRRISPDDLADARGFADDWAEGRLHQDLLSCDEVEKLAFLKYGLPRDAASYILHWADNRPEPAEWSRGFNSRAPRMGSQWRAEDAHRAVLTFLAECQPKPGNQWSHKYAKKLFKLQPAGRKVAMPVEPPKRRRNGCGPVKPPVYH